MDVLEALGIVVTTAAVITAIWAALLPGKREEKRRQAEARTLRTRLMIALGPVMQTFAWIAYSGQRDHLFRGKAIADSCQADHSSKRGRVSVPPFGRKRTYLISNSVYKGRLGGGVVSGMQERA